MWLVVELSKEERLMMMLVMPFSIVERWMMKGGILMRCIVKKDKERLKEGKFDCREERVLWFVSDEEGNGKERKE